MATLTLYIGNNLDPVEILTDDSKTVKEVYAENSTPLSSGSLLTLDARKLGDAELDKTLTELGAEDGAYLTINGKMMSANR